MKCFYHNDRDAVGICKNCNKGLCIECAKDVQNGIACPGTCETEVISINKLINRNKSVHNKTSGAYWKNAIIYLALGITFIIYGYKSRDVGSLMYFMIPSGVIFLVGAVFNIINANKINNEE